eukprot:CAMPEP_0117652576 /NCGR_PEP_ID=MMETSP0804-20121206/2701_1 /TAXON_ID=1074897 /ORGANISM="Tetraselmis astigmatica, Strain CCMP880" /LENGTH=109 /DNA_ID=CAMNT_0005458633 /DNA_START=1208 /DNA_END=1538 /DNA_ORIENTATION=+
MRSDRWREGGARALGGEGDEEGKGERDRVRVRASKKHNSQFNVRAGHLCGGAAVSDDLRGRVHVALVENSQGRAGEVESGAVYQVAVALEILGKQEVRAELCVDGDGPP